MQKNGLSIELSQSFDQHRGVFRLTVSLEMAELVERLGAFDLAGFIYRAVGAHYEVASCLLQTGSFKQTEKRIFSKHFFD